MTTEDFPQARLTEPGRFRLFSRGAADGARLDQLTEVADRWAGEPAGTFGSAQELGGRHPAVTRAIRDVLVGEVDDQLQAIYRTALRSATASAPAEHFSRLRIFRALSSQASALTQRFDWRWLDQWLGLDAASGTSLQRLSNFALKHDRVNLRLTYHCNAACRHCYNESGPSRKGPLLDLDRVRGLIREMRGIGIGALNLTGGEPFLYPDYILDVVAEARRAGLEEISIYTNGFWAASVVDAVNVLKRLGDAGFMHGRRDHVKVSTGRYHEEFIGFDRVLNLAAAYHATFARRIIVDVELDAVGPDLADSFRSRVARSGLESAVDVHFRRVTPHGRGQHLPAGASGHIGRPCRVIDQIVFEPGGTARPCCGFNHENQGVVIGDIAQHSLRVLVKRMQNDPLLQLLSSQPIERVFDVVDVAARPGGYPNICSLCQHAVGGLADKAALLSRLFDSQRFYPFWFSENDAIFADDAFPAP